MSIEFSWSETERAEVAARLRGTSLIDTVLKPEMEAALSRVTIEERQIATRVGPSRVLILRPDTLPDGPAPLFVNIHGGGFVRGYQHRDTVFCAEQAVALGAVVFDVDYRLAPEHPFPTALHECYDIVKWAFDNAADLGVDTTRIALGGHSAGGNLTAAVSLMANQSKEFRLCGQILDYPFVDGVTEPEDKLEPHSIFPAERLRAFSALYAKDPENLRNPLLSPIMADDATLTDLPHALIIIAGLDPLRGEAQRYAARLIGLGNDVDVRQFADCDHGFIVAGQARYRDGRNLITNWLAARFAR